MIAKKRGKAIFKNKKASTISHDLFFNVFELVLAIIVILALFNFVSDVAKQTIFEKNYLARDMAILINILYSAPGDVAYYYDENTDKFTFDFQPNKIVIYKPEDKENPQSYPFAENKNMQFRYNTLTSKQDRERIVFSKSDNQIIVTQEIKFAYEGETGSGGTGGTY